MDLIPVKSTKIDAVGYLPVNGGLLVIRFTRGGTYVYEGVPSEIYQSLMQADSKGKYFEQHIKGQFEFERLDTK